MSLEKSSQCAATFSGWRVQLYCARCANERESERYDATHGGERTDEAAAENCGAPSDVGGARVPAFNRGFVCVVARSLAVEGKGEERRGSTLN